MKPSYTPARTSSSSRPFDGEREFHVPTFCRGWKKNMSGSLITPTHPSMASVGKERKKFSMSTPPIFANLGFPTVSPNFESAQGEGKRFKLKDVVKVESRTWPGINKPGGMGRIIKINNDNTYNVAYILGGKEHKVPAKYISESSLMSHTPDRTIKPRDFYMDYLQENVLSVRKNKRPTPNTFNKESCPQFTKDDAQQQRKEFDPCDEKGPKSTPSLKRQRSSVSTTSVIETQEDAENDCEFHSNFSEENDSSVWNARNEMRKKKKKKKKHHKDKKREKKIETVKFIRPDNVPKTTMGDQKKEKTLKIRIGNEHIMKEHSDNRPIPKLSDIRVEANSIVNSIESAACDKKNVDEKENNKKIAEEKKHNTREVLSPERILKLRQSKELDSLDLFVNKHVDEELRRNSTAGLSKFVLSCRRAAHEYRPYPMKYNSTLSSMNPSKRELIIQKVNNKFSKLRESMKLRHRIELDMLTKGELRYIPNKVAVNEVRLR